MASTILSRILNIESMKNKIPSIRMIHSAAWNESTYDRPVMLTILATTTAKKLLSPIPGASANGLLARNAMTNIPTAEAIHVARNTPFHSAFVPSAPNPVRRFGLRAMMYAIVMNVVRPARISVLTVVLFCLSLKIFSNIFLPFLLSFFAAVIRFPATGAC